MKYSEYAELKRHGTKDFPIEYFYVDDKHPRYVMTAHWHKKFEIIRVISGSFDVYLDNVEYNLSEGDVLFIEYGCLHRGIPNNCVYECIVFDINMLRKQQNDAVTSYFLPIIDSSVRIKRVLSKKDDILYSAVNSILYALKHCNPYYELEVYSGLFKLFAQLYSRGYITNEAKQIRSRQAEKITALIDWIEDNYTEEITLEMLADKCGISQKYLCRIFKNYTDKTPINFINELRIENACHELSVKKNTVTQAALLSGFNDLSYFSKTFKQHKGITPKQYKNKYSKI